MLLFSLTALSIFPTGCGVFWVGEQEIQLGRGIGDSIRLVPDTAEVRKAILKAKAAQNTLSAAESLSDIKVRKLYVRRVNATGALVVPGRTRARLIERSGCRCHGTI